MGTLQTAVVAYRCTIARDSIVHGGALGRRKCSAVPERLVAKPACLTGKNGNLRAAQGLRGEEGTSCGPWAETWIPALAGSSN